MISTALLIGGLQEGIAALRQFGGTGTQLAKYIGWHKRCPETKWILIYMKNIGILD